MVPQIAEGAVAQVVVTRFVKMAHDRVESHCLLPFLFVVALCLHSRIVPLQKARATSLGESGGETISDRNV